MSNSIGFTNFRRFKNFPEIDLGDITILVCGNNAGKSTLVKAMLLMRDFLKSRVESSETSNANIRQIPSCSCWRFTLESVKHKRKCSTIYFFKS